MSEHHGADRVRGGEASLGEAQASNPPDDPEMIEPDAMPLDADVGDPALPADDPPPPEERGNEDPSPNAP